MPNSATGTEIIRSTELFLHRYPKAQFQDIYKGFFQDEFGPGHLLENPEMSRKYLLRELSSVKSYHRYSFEPCGLGQNFVRVSLDLILDGCITVEKYFQYFQESAQAFQLPRIETWIDKWNKIEREIRPLKRKIEEYDKGMTAINQQLSEGNVVAHHSEVFARTYDPHYRIFHKPIALLLLMDYNDSEQNPGNNIHEQ